MTAIASISWVGSALPAVGAVVIALLVVGHRRGGARTVGLLGALLIMVGSVMPVIAELAGYSLTAISADASVESLARNGAVDFVLAALPGTLMAVGLVAVAVAIVRRAPDAESGSVE